MSILARYLARAWLAMFATSLGAATTLYVVIDVLNRVGEVLPFGPSATALVSYFLFKVPKIVYDVMPAASLLATLLALGGLTRGREVMAMRAVGLGTRRIAAPMLAWAMAASVASLVWSESVVPVASSRARWLWDVELKQKVYRGVFDAASLWFQSSRGFVYIRRFDADARRISGLSLYEADESFGLKRVTEVTELAWRDGAWVGSAGYVKELAGDDLVVRELAAGEFTLAEDPDNLATRRRRPEEFSSRQLRQQIALMQARGVEAGESLVDLHHKLAWPFAPFFVALLAVPMALRSAPSSGIARATGTGLVIGFAYWVSTGFALSAGRSGALPALAAAWATNAGCLALAALLYGRRFAR